MLERGSRNLHEPRRQPGANYHAPCLNHRLSSFGFQCKMIVILIGTESTQHISRINPSLPSTASSSGAGGRSGCGMPGTLGTLGTLGTPGRLPHGALTTSWPVCGWPWAARGADHGTALAAPTRSQPPAAPSVPSAASTVSQQATSLPN